MQVITGCLLGLTGMLVNFTQDYQENPENCEKIYKCVKKIIESNEVRQKVAHRGNKCHLFICTININRQLLCICLYQIV